MALTAARRAIVAAAVVAFVLLGWRANVFGIRSEWPLGSVATTFDMPLAYPGFIWTREGRSVGERELVTIAGPDHCGWGSATVMFIGWPPGTAAPDASRARQYIRDPRGVMGGRYRELLERDVTLPADARPTGYRLGAIELYVSASDEDEWIYVVGPSSAERWPRGDPMVLCA